MIVLPLPPEIEAVIEEARRHPGGTRPRRRRGTEYAISPYAWMQGLAAQGGLVVEGDESESELAEAITYLVESCARRAS